jgi:hypothetical protein
MRIVFVVDRFASAKPFSSKTIPVISTRHFPFGLQ